jgi:hypothetical protein
LRAASVLSTRPSVLQVGYLPDDHEIIFWVFIDRDDMEEVEAVFRSVQNLRRGHQSLPVIRLHVVPQGQIPESALPAFELVYTRA